MFTTKQRQKIVNEFIGEHGRYTPALFLETVEASKGKHPAWHFFEWDDEKAGNAYRLMQARDFVQDIRIDATFMVKTQTLKLGAPAFISPPDNRDNGGGYVPLTKRTMDDFALEASIQLHSWLKRYGVVLASRGVAPDNLEALANALAQPVKSKGNAA